MNGRNVWLPMLIVVALLAAPRGAAAETPAENDAEFFLLLAYKPNVTLGDAYQGVAMIVRGNNELKPGKECRELLLERQVARADWGDDLSASCTKGKLAYMVCQALGIKGGVMMRLLGPTERYCLFECQYLELMAPGARYQHVTGGELVGTLDRADDYRAEHLEGDAEQAAESNDDRTADETATDVEVGQASDEAEDTSTESNDSRED